MSSLLPPSFSSLAIIFHRSNASNFNEALNDSANFPIDLTLLQTVQNFLFVLSFSTSSKAFIFSLFHQRRKTPLFSQFAGETDASHFLVPHGESPSPGKKFSLF
ncbi:hypothetical protein VNO77_21003 [Canavalia gladiata]|uniref:Uncharacterized protein n=1 Tax=Canavalia gladiata TaxID=3824 RepID=A0AAN9LR60_CANGL